MKSKTGFVRRFKKLTNLYLECSSEKDRVRGLKLPESGQKGGTLLLTYRKNRTIIEYYKKQYFKKLSNSTQKEIDNLHRTVTSKEMQLVIKKIFFL